MPTREKVSPSTENIIFDFAHYDVTEKSFSKLERWLNNETNGSVTLDFTHLKNGFITIRTNLAKSGSLQLGECVAKNILKILADRKVFK